MTNEFGSANSLEARGGLFDSMEDEDVSEPSTAPETTDFPELPSDVAEHISQRTANNDVTQTVNQKKNKKSRSKVKAMMLLVPLAAALICAVVYLNTHVMLGELFGKHVIYSYQTTDIDLSGSDYPDYSPISGLKSLEKIDLTNSSFSELSDLYGCESLKKVLLKDRELSAKECLSFYSHLPDALLICKVNINGVVYDSQVTQITLKKTDAEFQTLYGALGNLKFLDMTSCEVSEDTYKALSEDLPECVIIIRTTICGREYTTDAETIRFEGEITKTEADQVVYFKNLKSVDIRYCTNPEMLKGFLDKHPDIKLVESIELLGKQFGTEDEEIDLRGKQFTLSQVKSALDIALPKMKKLKKIDMCGCGLSNDQMEKLCKSYPEIKFVWMLHLVKWDIRTDAVIFSALNSDGKEIYDQYDYALIFKYCTDLRALDLGHSIITDISAISSLKKLRAVILTDNKIKDISAFSTLTDLEFIEMNATNKVSSLEPLRGLRNLKYINLWGSVGISDLSPLYDHESLEIAIFERTVPKDERSRFCSSNPNCKTFYKVDSQKITTNSVWRDNPYRKKIKNLFGKKNAEGILIREWKYVVGFDEKTGEYIVDYNTDQYAFM